MSRLDLFLFPHKGLRHAMFDVAARLARTDFADRAAADAAVAEIRRVLGFLHEHAEHEHRTIFPVLGRFCPALVLGLRGEHARVAGQELLLERLLDQVELANTIARPAIGRRLASQWHRLTAAHLEHMEREELEANRVLQANLGDEELAAVRERVLDGMTAARRAEWQALILPVVSTPERELLLRAVAPEVAS